MDNTREILQYLETHPDLKTISQDRTRDDLSKAIQHLQENGELSDEDLNKIAAGEVCHIISLFKNVGGI